MRINLLFTALFSVLSINLSASNISRKAVVTRNAPVISAFDPLNSLSVGNGHFSVTVDVTGLQSYPQECENGIPLCAMSDWGWHSFPNSKGLKPEDTLKKMNLGHGREEVYAVEYKTEGKNKDATEYFRVNPHRLNLGNIGLVFTDQGKNLPVSEVKNIKQTLNLYDGTIFSNYTVSGEVYIVMTASETNGSGMLFNVKTKAFKKGKAYICLSLPYVTGKHADAATDWENDEKHSSEIVNRYDNAVLLRHIIDNTSYYVKVTWTGKASFGKTKEHTFVLRPKSEDLTVCVEYVENNPQILKAFNLKTAFESVKQYWNNWWEDGAIVDFSDCTDERAKELERRVVLSQYLTYINCANDTPPQETGLTYNSWYGRPHLEMTWWHMVDFSLWNRPQVLERIMKWYNDKAYPYAKQIAERQGFKGVRWMKMTDPWVGESPSNVGSFLTWQQPHYIYMAEELYRRYPNAVTLDKYAKQVEETAEFMADFAMSCDVDKNGKIRLYGQTAMQEAMSKDFSFNHPFEQAYWVYGLTTAQKWRERRGLQRHKEWDDIIRRMASLAEYEDIYTAGEASQPFLTEDGQKTEENSAFDPFNYGGDTGKKQLTETEFRLKCRSDHPAVLGACGLLPDYGLYDRAKMQRTLLWVFDNWNWDTTWGWDYGMTAMCAARLGDGESAVRALLIDKGKNTYLVSGHNYQEPKRLRLYLPGNGALLNAVAMMCAGWDGCPDVKNPGFPHNGKWNVKWEGLNKMQ